MRLTKAMFHSETQYVEHKKILKFKRVRCYNMITGEANGDFYVLYARGIADNRFMVHYHAEGGTTLLYEHPSMDLLSTLRELLKDDSDTTARRPARTNRPRTSSHGPR